MKPLQQLCAWLALSAGAAAAATPEAAAAGALPPAAAVVQVLSQVPAYQAARRALEAEGAVRRQMQAGPHDWVAGLNAARRTQRAPDADTSGEWELGVDRTLRWPGKRSAYEAAGSSRVALAEAAKSRVWREQARALLDRLGQCLKEQQAAALWTEQARLLEQQLAGVSRRRALGDAARIDEQQAQAAQLQARAQAQAAQRRSALAREVLAQEFPGLSLPATWTMSPSQDLQADEAEPATQRDAQWLAALQAANIDVELARREYAATQAQLGVDRAELQPDPTVGVRVGQARSGGERYVGVALSLPFGGEHRSAAVEAAAARAQAAQLRLADAERHAQAQATQRLREAQALRALAREQSAAAERLDDVARGLQRAYQLGEGTMSEVINARRLAMEQQLSAAASALDAWLAQQRLALEGGLLWAEGEGAAGL